MKYIRSLSPIGGPESKKHYLFFFFSLNAIINNLLSNETMFYITLPWIALSVHQYIPLHISHSLYVNPFYHSHPRLHQAHPHRAWLEPPVEENHDHRHREHCLRSGQGQRQCPKVT